jgi:hypothetical protein
MEKDRKSRSTLEQEVIVVTTLLYLLICGAILAIHYLQPESRPTITSSPSPSQSHFSGDNAKQK